MTNTTQVVPELIDVLSEFRSLQLALVEKLQSDHPTVADWEDLTGLPRHGIIVVGGRHWEFHAHGLGISFVEQSSGLHINCHRGLAGHADAFDSGRIVEFLKSRGLSQVLIEGNAVTFDFPAGHSILATLCSKNIVKPCDALPGRHYELNQ